MTTAQAPSLLRAARRLASALLALYWLAGASGAWAQWQWRDGSGRRIFSDTPPPISVPDKDVLQRPKGASPASPVAGGPDAPPPPTATAPRSAQSAPPPESTLEQRKQQMEKAEAAKRKADEKAAEDKAAAARTINCDTARKNKATIESGVRVTVTNARGEAEFLDEAGRAAQLRQANEAIRENCR